MQKNKTIIITLLVIVFSAFFIFFMYKNNNNLSSADSPSKKITKEESLITIVAFGDSLTAGYGVSLEESYPKILEQKLNEQNISVKVINMGVSGETTEIALERLDFINNQNPDIILLGIGANDMLRSLPPEKTKINIEKIINYFQEKNKGIILLGMKSINTNGPKYRESFNSIYTDLSKKYSLPLVPFFLEGVALNETLNISDGIHPNYLGYQKIVSDNIIPIIIPYLEK